MYLTFLIKPACMGVIWPLNLFVAKNMSNLYIFRLNFIRFIKFMYFSRDSFLRKPPFIEIRSISVGARYKFMKTLKNQLGIDNQAHKFSHFEFNWFLDKFKTVIKETLPTFVIYEKEVFE